MRIFALFMGAACALLCACSKDEPVQEEQEWWPLPSHERSYRDLLKAGGTAFEFSPTQDASGAEYTLAAPSEGGEYVISLNPDASVYVDGVRREGIIMPGTHACLGASFQFIDGYDELDAESKAALGADAVSGRMAFTPDTDSDSPYEQECFGGVFRSGTDCFTISVAPNTRGVKNHFAHIIKFHDRNLEYTSKTGAVNSACPKPISVTLHILQASE